MGVNKIVLLTGASALHKDPSVVHKTNKQGDKQTNKAGLQEKYTNVEKRKRREEITLEEKNQRRKKLDVSEKK